MMRTLVDSRRATRLPAATVPRTPPTPRFTFYHWPSSCPFACVLLVATNVLISSSVASDPPPSLMLLRWRIVASEIWYSVGTRILRQIPSG